MRNLLLLLVIVGVMLSPTANAEVLFSPDAAPNAQRVNKTKKFDPSDLELDDEYIPSKSKGVYAPHFYNDPSALLPMTYAGFNHDNPSQPIAYDPISGSLFIARSLVLYDSEGNFTGTGGVTIVKSTDGGASWFGFDTLHTFDAKLGGWPAIGAVNPEQTTNIEQVMFAIYNMTYDPTNGNLYSGPYMTFYDGIDVFTDEVLYPQTNDSPDNLQFHFAKSAASTDPTNPVIMWGTNMLPDNFDDPSIITDGNNYGSMIFTFQGGGNYESRIVPEPLWAKNFRTITDDGSAALFRSDVEVGMDGSGNGYIGVLNLANDNPEFRLPAFSKTADNGDTWDDLKWAPSSLVTNYIDAEGGNYTYFGAVSGPYNRYGFAVLGEDNVSFFYKLFVGFADAGDSRSLDSIAALHLVEVNYNAGNWTINKVAELNEILPNGLISVNPEILQRDRDLEASKGLTEYALRPYDFQATPGHDIEAAVTADGSHVIVKYIDHAKEISHGADSIPYWIPTFDENNFPDTIQVYESGDWVTDVFMANREISGGAWSDEINVTNDFVHYKYTFMPKVVESINSVPFMSSVTGVDNSYSLVNSDFIEQNRPEVKRWNGSFFSKWEDAFYTLIGAHKVDASQDRQTDDRENPYNWSFLLSVEDQLNVDFELSNVYPNPAVSGSEVNVTYELVNPAKATLKVVDALGQEVMTVFNEMVPAGISSQVISTSNLSSGSYYVVFSIGDKSATQLLNVVK